MYRIELKQLGSERNEGPGNDPFFCFGVRGCKNKGPSELWAPIPTHPDDAEHFHPSAQDPLAHEIRWTRGFLSQKMGGGGAGCDVWDRERKRGRAHIFEDRGTRRCIWLGRMGRATETCNSLGEKSPMGPTEEVACSGMGTEKGTILYKREETHYWETREGVN